MKKYLKVILVIFACFLFVGCGSNTDNNENITGDTAEISLAGNASTGYQWTYIITDEKVLSVKSSKYDDGNTKGIVGASGVYSFLLTGLKEGETTIVFSYARSWEENVEPLYTLTYTFIVDSSKKISYVSVTGTYLNATLPVPTVK